MFFTAEEFMCRRLCDKLDVIDYVILCETFENVLIAPGQGLT